MVTINTSTIRQNVWETVYDTLNDANLLSSTVTVTGAYIDEAKAFPQVVVKPVSLDTDEHTLNRDYLRRNIDVTVDIWTKKSKQIDQISDEIDAIGGLKDIAGVHWVGMTEDTAISPQNEQKVHLKTLVLSYRK